MHRRTSFLAAKARAALGALCLALALGLASAAGTARADDQPAAVEVEQIRDVIAAQLEAFQRDDAQGAFSLVSPGIREKLGSPERFMAMVREQYLPVYRAKKVQFREPFDMGGDEGVMQPAIVTGPDDVPVYAIYAVERQADGAWRISGCLLYPIVTEETGTSI
ncbi:MAG: DUF4864 domain-containing protein [Alphaproteobacteria bacterium]